MLGPRQVFLLCIVLCICAIGTVESTDIKWTANEKNTNNEAATAPKSQKYWDQHGIKRPDYAKTDAEIAKERGKGGASALWFVMVPFLLAGVAYFVMVRAGGHRLGGSHSFFHKRPSADEARQARLERFELNEHKAE